MTDETYSSPGPDPVEEEYKERMRQFYAKDDDGVPLSRVLWKPRVFDREVTELCGLAKGLILDQHLSDGEILGLRDWLRHHPDVAAAFPGRQIAKRVVAALDDGFVDEAEREDLLLMLQALAGGEDGVPRGDRSISIFDENPSLLFDGGTYVLTGRFAMGSRPVVTKRLEGHGARVQNGLTSFTNYLVVGLLSNPAWIQGTYGRKIEDAIAMREAGHPLRLVSEEQLAEQLEYMGA